MITFWRLLWPLLSHRTRRKLVVAAAAMAALAVLEGVALVLLVPLLQLLTSNDFTASTAPVDLFADLLGRRGSSLALALALLAFATYSVKGVGAIATSRWSATFAMEEEISFVDRLLRAYLGAPLPVHHERNTADFQRTINQSLRTTFSQAFVSALSSAGDLLGVAIVAVVLVASAPVLAAVGVGYFALVVGIYQRFVQRSVRAASTRVHADQAHVFREVQQALAAVKEIKAGAVEEPFVAAVADTRRSMVGAYRTMALMAIQPRYVMELAMVGAAAVVAVVAYTTTDPARATADIAVFLAGGFRLLAPINKVFAGLNLVRSAQAPLEQIADDLRTLGPAAAAELAEPEVEVALAPRLEVRGLSFAYGDGPPVLRGVDLDLRPGESIAIVGGSGAGKSTLVDILLGLLPPTSGTVEVDGHPLAEVRRPWQRAVAYVPQTISLLDASVRENVVFGHDDGDDEQVWSALRDAQLVDAVVALPEGLDTRIGEMGVRLSGGQRQRLGVARALYRRPLALVLDEATSALDNETESELTKVLAGLGERLTSIAIAHRLSTVRHVDRVYFLAGGEVVDVGSFDDLQDRVPAFARLVELSLLPAGAGGG